MLLVSGNECAAGEDVLVVLVDVATRTERIPIGEAQCECSLHHQFTWTACRAVLLAV